MTFLPEIEGIHHLKFPVSDIDRGVKFYERALGAQRIHHLDHLDDKGHLFAVLLSVPNLGTLIELRLNVELANRHRGFDPLTLTVKGRAELEQWIAHFDATEVPHSPILNGIVGWVVVFEDPDGRRLRLYTRETHGPELKASFDSPWLF